MGLMAIFLVDFANLFYISLLGKQELAAAIGYAGTILFFNISICIGIMISAIALVSRALGAGDRERARKVAGSSIIFLLILTIIIAGTFLPFIGTVVGWLGATGETKEIATNFLLIVVPSMPLLGLGMASSGLLRAVGDARRAMYVTLVGGLVAAILDPIFIFTFDLGIYGAAYVVILTRLIMTIIGLFFVVKVHDLLSMPSFAQLTEDIKKLADIAFPAVLTNIATPVGNAFVTAAIAPFGDDSVAAWAVIGRLIPVAFGFIFALSGAIGPIVGQNYGAGITDRVRETVIKSLWVTVAYTLFVWFVLILVQDIIIENFNISGEAAELVAFFINFVTLSFLFNGIMFVANAAFNNLGYATYSTALNWGKATIGTIPFVWAGASIAGAHGVLAGQGLGSVVFGIVSIWVALKVVEKIGKEKPKGPPPPPLWRAAISAFSSGKGANLS